jgi:hypothetical protein
MTCTGSPGPKPAVEVNCRGPGSIVVLPYISHSNRHRILPLLHHHPISSDSRVRSCPGVVREHRCLYPAAAMSYASCYCKVIFCVVFAPCAY